MTREEIHARFAAIVAKARARPAHTLTPDRVPGRSWRDTIPGVQRRGRRPTAYPPAPEVEPAEVEPAPVDRYLIRVPEGEEDG